MTTTIKAKEAKKEKHPLPNYTRGEEIFNMVSHIVGGGFGVIALVSCVIVAALNGNVWGIVSGAIYGATMILLYTMSSVYHGVTHTKAKKVLRVFDHCSIFLLIAGTYTPITLCTFNGALGWTIFGVIWGLAALGITLNGINVEKFKIFSMIAYLGMGWMVIFAVKPLLDAWPLSSPPLLFMLAGGVAYTVGAVFYGFGKKVKYIHSVWHLFVVLGSVLQFVTILVYIMPVKVG